MTAPAPVFDPLTVTPGAEDNSVQRLSRMVTGNDNLVSQPGLVQAMFEQNATPQQAQAINQFLGALELEKKVRSFAASAQKMPLSDDEQATLRQMGVPFDSVVQTKQDALESLKAQMAAQGVEPVMSADGVTPVTDAAGNVQTRAIPKPAEKKGWSFGRVFHDVTHNPITSLVVDGTVNTNGPDIGGNGPGLKGIYHGSVAGVQWASATISQQAHNAGTLAATTPLTTIAQSSPADQELMTRLGYDPTSFFSVQAFKAKGYAHNDTSHIADQWDQANPEGLFGWDGQKAVLEAEAFAADPQGYQKAILQDPSNYSTVGGKTVLLPQGKAKLDAINSDEFKALSERVNAGKASIGNDFASGVGIDPVKHPTLFKTTSVSADLMASFFIDPLSIGLTAYQGARVAKVAIDGFSDAPAISRILDKSVEGNAAMWQQRANLQQVVDLTNDLVKADRAGDAVKAAQIQARLDKNPIGFLSADAAGKSQILRDMTPAEAEVARAKGQLPKVIGVGERLDTYDKLKDYVVSNNALMRLQGGIAPAEARYMPGATSSAAFQRMRGSLASWSAGRSAGRAVAAEDKFMSWATDPARAGAMFDNKSITRVLANEGDEAVDVVSGRVYGAAITDAGRGELRRNQLSYGQAVAPETAAGKALAWATTGQAYRVGMVARRLRIFKNVIPVDTRITTTSATAGDTITRAARLYMAPGQISMLETRWALGDNAARYDIVRGIKDQIAHAAGLPKTKAGRDMMEQWKTAEERYATDGNEILIGGSPVALHPGQVQTEFVLPNFGAVHAAASKIGLYESTLGAVLSSRGLNTLMTHVWKIPALLTPVTAERGILEGWINSANEGLFGKAIQAKAMLKETGTLTGAAGRSRAIDRISSLAPIAQYSRFVRNITRRTIDDPQDVVDIERYGNTVMPELMRNQSVAHLSAMVDPAGLTQVRELAEQGLAAKQVKFDPSASFDKAHRTRTGFEFNDDIDGLAGAGLYATALAQRVNKTPGVAKAMLDLIEHPEEFDAGHVVVAMMEPQAKRLADLTKFGQVFWSANGAQHDAVTEAEHAIGRQQWAERMTNEFKTLLVGRNAVLNKKITGYIREYGRAPQQDWLHANVAGLDRPAGVLAPTFAPVVEGGVKQTIELLKDVEGKMFQVIVERQIQRHLTGPMHAAAWLDARKALRRTGYEKGLIDGGFDPGVAERIADEVASDSAWARVRKMVDDPAVKSQMDVVGRGFFAFSRATTMMLRRWGSTAWRNPVAARRLQLAGEGAVHAGLVYKDENGDWEFHFPGSGVAQEALFHAASHIPGLHGLVKFPTPVDFTGNVASMVPGSNNPFQYSTTPMISIAGREIIKMFPDQREIFDEIDRKLNGSAGQGQGVLSTLTPSLVKKFTQPFLGENDANSMLSSSMVGALYGLYAAGQVPKDGAPPSEMEAFYKNLRVQTKSRLFLRTLFGLGSPARLSSDDNNEWTDADYSFAAQGSQGLRDEFKRLLNNVDGDFGRATAVWTALHPDQTVYSPDGTVADEHLYSVFTQSGSHSTTSKAVMPATEAALRWMQHNDGFINKYKSIAGYFIPEQSAGEPYSQAAYRAQLEDGLRQRKTPKEFYESVRVSTAASAYYAMNDKYKEDVATAKASGDKVAASAFTAKWSAWSKAFRASNPIFAKHIEASAQNGIDADNRLSDLKAMVAAGDVPDKSMLDPLRGMVQAYAGYEAFIKVHPGSTVDAKTARSRAGSQMQDYMNAVIAAFPQLTDVYRGIFRGVDTNLDDPTVSGG